MNAHSSVRGAFDLFVNAIGRVSSVNAILLYCAMNRVYFELLWDVSWNSTSRCPYIVLLNSLARNWLAGMAIFMVLVRQLRIVSSAVRLSFGVLKFLVGSKEIFSFACAHVW